MLNGFEHMDSAKVDAFREISNIGAGNAATALSDMLSRKIGMSVPDVRIIPFTEIPDIMGGAEKIVVGGLVDMSGDLSGYIIAVLELKEAYRLASILTGRPEAECKNASEVGVEDLTELDLSALYEIVNILVGSYLSAISSMTSFSIVPSIPYMCVDMVGAMLSIVAIEYGKRGESVLYFETKFVDTQDNISCNFFLLPDHESYQKLLQSLGVDS